MTKDVAVLEAEAMTPMVMLDRAVASGASVEVLEKLMGLQERWEANQARKAYNDAISAVRSKLPVILKEREGHNYKYEDLGDIARKVDPILAEHGLSYRWRTESAGDLIHVTCVISHRGGHSEENTLSDKRDMSGSKQPIHGLGSTVSYLQRYTLKSGLGLAAAKDDDASAAAAGEPISDEQIKTILALIKEVNADTVKLCKYFKVATITDLPAKKYDDAIAALEAKRKKAS